MGAMSAKGTANMSCSTNASRSSGSNRQREVVDAFLEAARTGDFDALLAMLDPEVVLRADRGTLHVRRGACTVAEGAMSFARLAAIARPVLANGSPGIAAWHPAGQLLSVVGFTIRRGQIAEIDTLADAQRLQQLDLTRLET
jgi:hypothetical protein